MNDHLKFEGFPEQTSRFFADLEKHNEKKWFEQHREQYENHVLIPARAFVYEMGEKLKKLAPGIHADPRVDKSIFRIFRDTRFSKNKKPFKTHLGIWFWDGDRGRMECSGYYFQLDKSQFWFGAGMYLFPRDLMGVYREAVADDKLGPKLTRIIKKALKAGPYELGGSHYKRVPRGYDPDHKRADLLKHNTLHLGLSMETPKVVRSRRLIDFCYNHSRTLTPLHRWLTSVMRQP